MTKLDVLTVEEVAQVLKVTPATVLRMIKREDLPAFRIGTRYRIRATDVNALVNTAACRDG